ncbi:DUF6286 domain-containing protein [Streptomyces sp. NPDC086777]|uniref:DUF6286 domain-containing Asp23/Gls24 family envelope stress response protein n=1 Tax=Streptomyces sp. NPDC086777 TaxID=3154866 RepID=UPI00344E24B5
MTAAAERGTTVVAERVVRRVAEQAAAEALRTRDGARTARASASVRGRRAEVSLRVTLPYPAPLAESVHDVQRHVVERIRELTGLEVPTARVGVTSLAPAMLAGPLAAPAGTADAKSTPRRWWSERRIPVALLTWAATLAFGTLAFDLARVHLAHRAAAAWRTSTVHWLSGNRPGGPAVTVAGGLVALAGTWLIVLALTPGRRRQCTVRGTTDRFGVAVDRSAVTALVRDAVGDVAGIGPVRVRVRSRRVAVRAVLAFGDRQQAHTAATAAARTALAACLLRRGPRVRVTVVPEPAWRPPAPTAGPVPPEAVPVTGGLPGGDR